VIKKDPKTTSFPTTTPMSTWARRKAPVAMETKVWEDLHTIPSTATTVAKAETKTENAEDEYIVID